MSTEIFATTRRYRRTSLPQGMLVAWYRGGEQRVSRVKILGMGGLFVAEPNAPGVGTYLRLSFEVSHGSRRTQRHAGQSMGIEFVRLNTRDRVLMEILLRRLLREIPE